MKNFGIFIQYYFERYLLINYYTKFKLIILLFIYIIVNVDYLHLIFRYLRLLAEYLLLFFFKYFFLISSLCQSWNRITFLITIYTRKISQSLTFLKTLIVNILIQVLCHINSMYSHSWVTYLLNFAIILVSYYLNYDSILIRCKFYWLPANISFYPPPLFILTS